MASVGFITEAQWTAKRAFGVYHDDMEACRRRWKDEGVVKVVLADLESCVTSIQNDTNIHFLYTVSLDRFQDIIDRKNTFATPTLLDLSHAHISLLVLNPASSLH
jgi:hypothetical protein